MLWLTGLCVQETNRWHDWKPGQEAEYTPWDHRQTAAAVPADPAQELIV